MSELTPQQREDARKRSHAEIAVVTTFRNVISDCEAVVDYLNRFDAPIAMVEDALDVSGEVAAELRRLHDDFDVLMRMQARKSIEELL